jgi:preprotein translocase subunit SecA
MLERAIRHFEPKDHGQFALVSLADLVEAHDRLDGTLPDDVLERVERLRGEWAAHSPQRFAEAEPRASAKIGRNDPCPCGSGRKYKRCCGA